MTGFPIKTIIPLVKESPWYIIVNIDENIINMTGNKAVNTLITVVKSVRVEVGLTLFTSVIAVVFAGILMYYAENESQPEVFSDMGQSIWWAVATLTTIGYGDIYPVTGLGKLIASSLAFIGIGLVAIPAGLISAAYVEELNKSKSSKD